jgi:hypothetical protein
VSTDGPGDPDVVDAVGAGVDAAVPVEGGVTARCWHRLCAVRLWVRRNRWARVAADWFSPALLLVAFVFLLVASSTIHRLSAMVDEAVAVRDVTDLTCEVSADGRSTAGTVTVSNRGGGAASYAVGLAYVGAAGQVVAVAHAGVSGLAAGARVTVPVSAVRLSAAATRCRLDSASRSPR